MCVLCLFFKKYNTLPKKYNMNQDKYSFQVVYVRLISTGPVQRLGRTLTRVLIGDAQPKMRLVGPHRAAL